MWWAECHKRAKAHGLLRSESNDLTRQQLLGMIALLRDDVTTLLRTATNAEDVSDAKRTLELTTFDLSPEDEVDGGFDKSWMD